MGVGDTVSNNVSRSIIIFIEHSHEEETVRWTPGVLGIFLSHTLNSLKLQ